MGTSSELVFQANDGKIYITYIKYDGYVEGVGAVLLDSVDTYEKAKNLITRYRCMGSIDIGPKISNGEYRNGYNYDSMEDYLEDRARSDFWPREYTYTFCNDTGKWTCCAYGKEMIDLYEQS